MVLLRWRQHVSLLALAILFSSGHSACTEQASASKPSWANIAAPSELTAEEEASPEALAIAKRVNPSMAFPTRDIWPTSVSYAWHDRPNIMARVVAKTGKVIGEHIAIASEALQPKAWAALRNTDDNGEEIEYFVDGPGDDRKTDGQPSWMRRWREIMRCGDTQDVTTATYPPTQYAHLFWFNREQGLLAVQYWFYYPYNYWINRHEGDWEHINVILKGPKELKPGAKFETVGYQFFFHSSMYEPQQVIRTRSKRDESDHVLVFTGGSGKLFVWEGDFSGGSYPFPAFFPKASGSAAGPLSPGDDTRHPKRFIGADQFNVVLLPEPHRVDPEKNPELAWLRLKFYAGQTQVYGNPFPIDMLGRGGPPQQPGRKKDWNFKAPSEPWNEAYKLRSSPLELPVAWQAQITPTALHPQAAALAAKPAARPRGALSAQRYLRAGSR